MPHRSCRSHLIKFFLCVFCSLTLYRIKFLECPGFIHRVSSVRIEQLAIVVDIADEHRIHWLFIILSSFVQLQILRCSFFTMVDRPSVTDLNEFFDSGFYFSFGVSCSDSGVYTLNFAHNNTISKFLKFWTNRYHGTTAIC